jgi:hypothetical protein
MGSPDPKNFAAMWTSGPALTSHVVSLSGPVQSMIGGGSANVYTILVPSASAENAAISSGSYLVIGRAVVNGVSVFVGSPTDPLATDSMTRKYLQVLQTGAGKVMAATTSEIPGSLLLIAQPEIVEFTSDEELLPVAYESVEGDWSSVVQANVPPGFVANPGALETSVSTSEAHILQFSVRDLNSGGSSSAAATIAQSVSVTHALRHRGRERSVTLPLKIIRLQPRLDPL